MLVFGPACGFILGSFCTKIYVDAVFIDTTWWGGFLLCGALLFFSSLPMFGFPQALGPRPERAGDSEQAMLPDRDCQRHKPSNGVLRHPLDGDSTTTSCFQQLRVTKHLLSNPVFTCIILAACMEIAVVAGFAAFLGKYLEQQFNLTTSSANQLLGMTAIPCACLGIFLGGLLVKKLSLSALGAIRMAMLVNLVSTACYVSFLFLGCDTGPVAGVTVPYGNNSTPTSSLDPYSPCNNNCECQTDSFTPVCGADGVTYLSACFAGCSSTNLSGCSCLTSVPPENATVVPGKCPSPGCEEAFLTFLCVMCVCSMIGAMAQTPSVIILIRTVSPELKSYALGVLFLLLRLLGFIPPPLIFGAGIDSTCLFWSTFCGEQGACALYDNVVYRYLYVSIAIALKSFAFILYTTTWQWSQHYDCGGVNYINNTRVLFNKNKERARTEEETTAKQQRQHRKLLSFSQSQTQPGFLRTECFDGITCDILQGAGESREPLWLGTSPFGDSTSFQGGHLQRFRGEFGTGCRESKLGWGVWGPAGLARLGAAPTCCIHDGKEAAVLEPFHQSHSVTSHEPRMNSLKAAGNLPSGQQCCQGYPSPSRPGLFTDCSSCGCL
ncbi:hypothetical protein EK904_008635 [Melospiza melodia maxima]|nr:hypothetical protein EK904_008635 [Melospiza melodia maxima]